MLNPVVSRFLSTGSLVAVIASAASVEATTVAAAPATSAVAGGTTTVVPRGAAYKALRGNRVTISSIGDVKRKGTRYTVPVAGGSVGTTSSLRYAPTDGLLLRRGSRSVRLTGLSVRLAAKGSRVTGRIDGGRAQTLFTLSRPALKVSGTQARATKVDWRLTAVGARKLRRELAAKRLRAGAFARTSFDLRVVSPDALIPGTPAPATPGGGGGGGTPAPTPPATSASCRVLTGDEPTQNSVLDWGLKQSFRNYIGGEGTITTSNGAVAGSTGSYWFGRSSVTAAGADGSLSAAFRGAVYFEKYGTGEAAMLRLWLCNPRIEAPSGAGVGSLFVDMLSKSLSDGKVVEYPNARLAEIDLTKGSRTLTGGFVRWTNVPAKLTAEGVNAFAGFYTTGTALDPLNLTVPAP